MGIVDDNIVLSNSPFLHCLPRLTDTLADMLGVVVNLRLKQWSTIAAIQRGFGQLQVIACTSGAELNYDVHRQ